MSSEVGEDKKSECAYGNQSNKREAKVVPAPTKELTTKSGSQGASK